MLKERYKLFFEENFKTKLGEREFLIAMKAFNLGIEFAKETADDQGDYDTGQRINSLKVAT